MVVKKRKSKKASEATVTINGKTADLDDKKAASKLIEEELLKKEKVDLPKDEWTEDKVKSSDKQDTFEELIAKGHVLCGKCGRAMKKLKTEYECPGSCELKTNIKGSNGTTQAAIPFDEKPKVPMIEIAKVIAFVNEWERISILTKSIYQSYVETDDVLIRCFKKFTPEIIDYIEKNSLPSPQVVVTEEDRQSVSKTD